MQQRGFTLIELIIVIVILGILAVTAAPRFIDLQGDARSSTLDGVKAALQGGAQLVYAKAAIGGVQGDAGATVSINGVSVTTDFGYPEAEAATDATLGAWASLETTDWDLTVSTDSAPAPSTGTFAITPSGTAYTATATDACQVLYTEAADADSTPTITVESDGC